MRHIRFIALGSAIGTGLFLGSAETIKGGGPAVLLAYLIAGIAVFMVMRALGEMAVRHPVAGSFANYAHHYLGPYFGFLAGWTFVFEVLLVCVADMTAVTKYMKMWAPDVPGWVWMVGSILLIVGLNLMRVRVFGELEFWFSLIKIVTIIAMIAGGAALLIFGISVGGHHPSVSNLWEGAGGFMPFGVWGLVMTLGVVAFSFGGIETLGMAAGEADAPERSIPKAVNSVPLRILIFYILSLAVIMMLVPWNDLNTDSSPFVTVFGALGIPAAEHIINAVVLTAALSAMNSLTYAAVRLMYGLSKQGHAPQKFSYTSATDVPAWPVLVSLCFMVGGLIAYLIIPDQLFFLVASLTSFAIVVTWVLILSSHLVMRRRMKAEGLKSTFPMPGSPVTNWLAIAFSLFVLVVQLFGPIETKMTVVVGFVWLVLASAAYFLLVKGRGRNQLQLVNNKAALVGHIPDDEPVMEPGEATRREQAGPQA